MTTVEFETARKCPRCDIHGEIISSRPGKTQDGSPCTIHVLRCQNERCSWFDTDWIVQQLSDGTVPVREGVQEKTFPTIPGMTSEKARRVVTAITEQDDRRRRRKNR